jgi:hypothetical protein
MKVKERKRSVREEGQALTKDAAGDGVMVEF